MEDEGLEEEMRTQTQFIFLNMYEGSIILHLIMFNWTTIHYSYIYFKFIKFIFLHVQFVQLQLYKSWTTGHTK